MKRITSLVIFFIVSLTVLIMFPVVALSEPIGTFTYIKGRVDITAPGMKAVPAHKGDDVNVGDIIRTKSDSKAEILLIDGSTLRLAQKSRVEISEYMVEKKQTRGILKLFRGKIQNIVKTAGKTFGRKRLNRYEVQTPTAVCGVRGTNFFVFYRANISGAMFKKGSGYGYSLNRPDVLKIIKAGQAMIVIDPDIPPVIKPATDLEIEQHVEDTAPSDEEEEAEEEKEEKVEAVKEAVEEVIEAEKEAVEEALSEEKEIVEEVIAEVGEIVEEAYGAGLSVDVDLGSLDADIADSLAVEIDTVDTALKILEPYIPPETPAEGITTLRSDLPSSSFPFLTDGTLSSSIDDTTNRGTFQVSGTADALPVDPWSGQISGSMSDESAFSGYFVGVSGTWEGLISSIYVTGSGAGYISGSLSGTYDSDTQTLSGSGPAIRTPVPGNTTIAPDMLDSVLETLGSVNDSVASGYPISVFGSITAESSISSTATSVWGEIHGISTESGGKVGVWGVTTSGGAYNNDDKLQAWSGAYGQYDYCYDAYMLGSVSGTDDMNGHVSISGGLIYMDQEFLGNIGLDYRGVYDTGGAYRSVGSGTYTLAPLAFSNSFDDDTYRTVSGTVYEGDFERKSGVTEPYYDAHYDYQYFVSEGGVLLYGEKWHDYYKSDSEYGDIYLPDGTHVSILDDDFLTFTTDSWTVGDYDSNSAFFSDPPSDGGDWERHWYDEWDSNCLAKSGTFSGIMGGTGDLWSATDSNPAGISLMGIYKPADGDYSKPSIFGLGIQSSDITSGAYAGYLSGITDGMNGNIYAVYIDPLQNAGIVKGGFSGDVYPDIKMWKASGSVYPITGQSISISAADLGNNLDYGLIAGWLSGDFGVSDSLLFSELGWGETLAIRGQDWGVYRLSFGYDNYLNNPGESSTWSARAGGYAEFGAYQKSDTSWKPDTGIWLTSLMTGSLDDGVFASSLTGNFLTHTKYGQLAGDITGTDANNAWQAVASGYWESSQDLKFNGVLRGDNLKRMVEEYSGHWDDGTGGSYYDYIYYTGVDAGWSCEYDANGNTETHIDYYPDGTTESWVDDNGVLSYNEGTWGGDLYLDNLKIGSSLAGGEVPQDPDPSTYLAHGGWIDGFMGGLDNLWLADASNQADLVFIGECNAWWYDEDTLPSVFTLGIESYNPYDDSCTIWNQDDNSQNGAYFGYMGGRILEDNVSGGIMAIYVDDSGNAGILKGSFDGTVYLYPDLEMWDAAEGIYPVEIVQGTGFNASDFHPDGGGLISQICPEGSAEFHGKFFDASNELFGGDIYRRYGASKRAAVKTTGTLEIDSQFYDQYLSVASTIKGGTYTEFGGNTFDHWYLPFSFDRGTTKRKGYLLSFSETGGSWSDNMISGKGVGAWVNLEDAVTGVSGADLKGTFNPANTTWQTAAMWAGIDTRTFLDMTATTAGKDNLAQLNIPCIEVGKTDLTGSAHGLSVNMKDTTFFAYSTGASPRIWATGDVSGMYTSDPSVGTSVPLIGTSPTCNINASFDVQKWDTNKWAAGVTGSGTVNSHSIDMTGSAAGTYGTSTFSGTGAGVAVPPTP